MKTLWYLLLASLWVWAAGCMVKPRQAFEPMAVPAAPDYSQDRYWAALPWRTDVADLTPDGLTDRQAEAPVDVFFLHPTTYIGKRGDKGWNGPVDDPDLNARTDAAPIQFQASIFNGVGRVFAPYYRQAHLNAYFNADTASARRAFAVAYADVRNAFEYYLAHHNAGRPIIIASHSQGTTHAKRLVQEFFDGKPLQSQLVVAYLVGIPVQPDSFVHLRPCADSLDVGCLVSWRTWRRGHTPKFAGAALATNPLLWTTTEAYAPASANLGGVVRPFEVVRPGITDAQVQGSVLWAAKPRFPGSVLFTRKNYHIGDFNLYYLNVRTNARARVEAYQRSRE